MKYSVIIPIHNEEDSVETLVVKVCETMDLIGGDYEVVAVDDASTDRSAEILKNAPDLDGKLTLIRLLRRRGLAGALQAGFDTARGDVLVTLDADLQNDPADIPRLLSMLGKDCDMVCGWRKKRRDPVSKKIASAAANRLRKILTREKIHDVGCTLRVFKREVVRNIRLSGGLHRYFTALAARQGFRIAEMEVRHFPRTHGVSKFGVWDRLFQGTKDLFRIRSAVLDRGESRLPDYEIRETVRK